MKRTAVMEVEMQSVRTTTEQELKNHYTVNFIQT